MTETQPFSILITDDDRGIRDALQEIFEARGFRTYKAADGPEALEIVQAEPVHLAVLDMHMPQMTGLETLQMVRQVNAVLPAILVTADATLELMRQAFHAQVFSVIPKPVNKNIVLTMVVRALIRVYGDQEQHPELQQPESGESKR